MKASLILPCFNRAKLLDIGLFSISKYSTKIPYEVIVINDGIIDETEEVCNKYKKLLDIKYYFSGQRNIDKVKSRVPAYAINIGVKKATGDIIVLSSPEVYHLNQALNYLFAHLLKKDNIMTTVKMVHFDDSNEITDNLLKNKKNTLSGEVISELNFDKIKGKEAVTMPFLLAFYKKHFMNIRGYDEDFIGYACDDNDFMDRMKKYGLRLQKTDGEILHLYHQGTNISPLAKPDNPEWLYNYNLYKSRQDIIKRNENREWGVL